MDVRLGYVPDTTRGSRDVTKALLSWIWDFLAFE